MTMTDLLGWGETFATDPRSWLIAVAWVGCILFARRSISKHAVMDSFLLCIVLVAFGLWRYGPDYEMPLELTKEGYALYLESLDLDQLRAHMLERREATNVLWRQLEIYILGIHLAAVAYIGYHLLVRFYPPAEVDLMTKLIIGTLAFAEGLSALYDNFICRFIYETPGADLVDLMILQGWVPSSCEMHHGKPGELATVGILVAGAAFIWWAHKRARDRMT